MKANQVQEINETEFDSQVLHCKKTVLVGFLTKWSQACERFIPVLEEVAAACRGNAQVFQLDVDDNPDLGTRYGIQSVPTLLFFFNGIVRVKIVGTASAKAVLVKLQSLSQQLNPAPGQELRQTTTQP